MAFSGPRTIIITGAGSGLGRATATRFLEGGDNVTVCDILPKRVEATQKEWLAAGFKPEQFLAMIADASNEASVQSLVDATVAKFGRLDVLVNNVGVMDTFSPTAECTTAVWNRMFNINVTSHFFVTRAVLPHFLKNGPEVGGVIIDLCSSSAVKGYLAGTAYTASKHAALGLSRSTAFAYGPKGIYSVAMNMGGMATNVVDAFVDGTNSEMRAMIGAAQTPFDIHRQIVNVGAASKYIRLITQRDYARGLNGAAIDFCNNHPEH